VRAGDRFAATDGAGHEYVLCATRVDRDRLEADVVERQARRPGAGRDITLAIGPPRGGRMEIAIEKTVECGVGRITPLETSRSVLKGKEASDRVERWRRVARSALAQSGRAHLPEITPFRTLAEVLADGASGTVLVAHPALTASSVSGALAGKPRPVTILVGPEGGFTDEELAEALAGGALQVSLGPTRLRTETAAIVAVALAMASL
jgi:16S rRNA (uracil1498-N3)-methyltransferase